MARAEKHPWDQQPDEPDEAYGRFLIYRGLGPGRSVQRSYQTYLNTFRNAGGRPKTPQVPGHWSDDSARWRWVDRAHAWDVHVLREFGERLAVRFVGALDAVAGKVVEALARSSCRPKQWKEVLDALDIISKYLKPDALGQSGDDTPGEPAEQPAAVVR